MRLLHFDDQPPRRLLYLVGVVGTGAAFWLFAFPLFYPLPAAINAVMPLVALFVMAKWRDNFHLWAGDGMAISPRHGLGILWAPPAFSLAYSVLSDFDVVLSPVFLLAGAGFGAAFTTVGVLLDKALRGWSLPATLATACLWGWASLMVANVELDRTEGRIRTGVITRVDRPFLWGDSFRVRFDDDGRSASIRVSETVLTTTRVGYHTCVEDNPGLFGWRTLWLSDCNGPLRELRPPAPSAPSPPR